MVLLKKKLGFVYEKAEREIEEQILSGRLKAGDCVLSENALCATYGISRRSARTAIENLIRKGLLYRHPGKGTFVSSLKSGTGKRLAEYSIALIIPDISDPFILNICKGIQAASNHYNCNLVIKTSNGDIDRENQNIRYSIQKQEDAVIIFPNYGRFNIEELWKLKEADIPFVLIDRYFEDIETNYVCVDNVRGGFLATEHLIQCGHSKIAHLYGSHNSANDGRLAGYRQALSAYDILSDTPSAVFAGNDYQALGAIRAIQEHGLRVPEDISIVGFDELNFNPFLAIPLTTIRQPQYEIGRNAVEILLRILNGTAGTAPEHIVLPVTLVEGASCRKRIVKKQ